MILAKYTGYGNYTGREIYRLKMSNCGKGYHFYSTITKSWSHIILEIKYWRVLELPLLEMLYDIS